MQYDGTGKAQIIEYLVTLIFYVSCFGHLLEGKKISKYSQSSHATQR